MPTLSELQNRYEAFLEDRNWSKYHTPRNVAAAISVEANELLELFLWHDDVPAEEVRQDEDLKNRVEDEVADVIIYCMSLAIHLDFDLLQAVESKLEDNEGRFDEDTAREISENLDEWQRS